METVLGKAANTIREFEWLLKEGGTLLKNHLKDSLHKEFPVLLLEPMHHTDYDVVIQPNLQPLAL